MVEASRGGKHRTSNIELKAEGREEMRSAEFGKARLVQRIRRALGVTSGK